MLRVAFGPGPRVLVVVSLSTVAKEKKQRENGDEDQSESDKDEGGDESFGVAGGFRSGLDGGLALMKHHRSEV